MMRPDVQEDFDWQAQFVPTIRKKVGPHLLTPAPMELDCSEATDFLVMDAEDKRIAARVRRHGYADDFGDQFTIRSRRDNGHRTEFAKIIDDGFGDWMFYGHYTGHPFTVYPWWLINLDVFRELWYQHNERVLLDDDKHIPNGDGTYFHAFRLQRITKLPGGRGLIIGGEYDDWTDQLTMSIMTDGRA